MESGWAIAFLEERQGKHLDSFREESECFVALLMMGLPTMTGDWTCSTRKLISVLFLVIPVLIIFAKKKSLLMKCLGCYQHVFNVEKDKTQNK